MLTSDTCGKCFKFVIRVIGTYNEANHPKQSTKIEFEVNKSQFLPQIQLFLNDIVNLKIGNNFLKWSIYVNLNDFVRLENQKNEVNLL